ncbi:MAG: glycoside hydrolase family 66 protein [Prevotellaceae bacterium]|jgi:dextranase|nr:glycoside hydrolase family 66 protein [Prevotellaceae bacterium]
MNKVNILIILVATLFSCNSDYYNVQNDPVTYGESYISANLSCDKPLYAPNEQVVFSLKELPANAKVRYLHLNQVIAEETLSGKTWTWTPPATDFQGYMVEIFIEQNGEKTTLETIGIDVSSDWAKFPRYGFLSIYDRMQAQFVERNIATLNRFHINGLQFYDWLYDHHRPMAGTVENPAQEWLDIFNRPNYFSTVKNYITAAKARNMKTMFYNLCYGATNNAAADGVSDEWYAYKDRNHSQKDAHVLGGRSSIWITNPNNIDWQNYLINRNKDVYAVFDFDGYHIDQLGERSTLYDYSGNEINMPNSFGSFIRAMKTAEPDKHLLFNAVGGYAQEKIANEAVDFLYAEIWGSRDGDNPDMNFADLIVAMRDNVLKSRNPEKNIVLAAYMNYNLKSAGAVNKAGVLLADAAIFAWGGAHLELGEHYLINEYFPANNLQMHEDLSAALINYYDFSVAYQNLLRDGGNFQAVTLSFADQNLRTKDFFDAEKGDIACVGKKVAGKDIIHLINFTNASTMQWRDSKGTQVEPQLIENPTVTFTTEGTASRVWFASPDLNGGAPQTLNFSQNGNNTTVTLPQLKYWDMIVVEY